MCGITGFYSFTDKHTNDLANIQQSNDKLSQRGPDSGAVFRDGQVALGHRRLSIIDTSTAASQPMQDPTGRYVIVFNGEIFNYRQLSEQYLSDYWKTHGGPSTHSDTEVLLHLLICYSAQCLPWLDGFFAFSFYDRHTGNMLLARDPFGKKPLLLFRHEQYLAFASEMKALLEWNIPRTLNYTALLQYLQLNYIPQPQSMLQGVTKLQPGHYLSANREGQVSTQPYYELKCRPDLYNKYSYEEAQQQLVQRLDNAVQERMISDVPLGAFLSGGIDSSVVVALASRHTDQLRTFSIGYKDNPFFDETSYARLVAKKYHTDHEVFSLSNKDFLDHVYGVLDYLDEPFADSSAIPVYILSHLTRQQVTVALSGDGADEVFSGYNKHKAEWNIRQPSAVKSLVRAGGPLWRALPHSRNNKLTNLFRQLDRFAEGASLSAKERYWRWAGFNTAREAALLLRQDSRDQINYGLFEQEKNQLLSGIQSDDFNEILLTDVRLVLLSDMLVKVDLMSMANSLEVRSPFLDKKVVDFAFSLPAAYKIDNNLKKKIVQDAFRPLLPEELYNRPKHGFEIPLLDWFRKELWGLINDDLLERRFVEAQGIFDSKATEQLKRKLHSSNPEDSPATIWALIVFQYWWKKYLA